MLCLSLSIDYFVVPYHHRCGTTYRVIPTFPIAVVIERLMLCLSLSVNYFVIPYHHRCRVTRRVIPTLPITVVIEWLMLCLLLSVNYFVIPYRHRCGVTRRAIPYLVHRHRCGATHAVLVAVHELFCHTLSPSLSSDLPSDSCRACRCSRTILSYFSHAFLFFLTLPNAS